MSLVEVRTEQPAHPRRHDGPVVDLERIKAETVAYFRALDEAATLRYHFRGTDEEGDFRSGPSFLPAVADARSAIAAPRFS